MNSASPTGPNGGSWIAISGSASSISASREPAGPVGRAEGNHRPDHPDSQTDASENREGDDDAALRVRLDDLPSGCLLSLGQLVDLLGEDARPDSQQELPGRVQHREDCEPDPAHRGRRALHTPQEQVDDDREQRNEDPHSDVHRQPGRDVAVDDWIEVLRVAGRVKEEQDPPGRGNADDQGEFGTAEGATLAGGCVVIHGVSPPRAWSKKRVTRCSYSRGRASWAPTCPASGKPQISLGSPAAS